MNAPWLLLKQRRERGEAESLLNAFVPGASFDPARLGIVGERAS